MRKKLYVGNLAQAVFDEDLRVLLAPYGTIRVLEAIPDGGLAKGVVIEMMSEAHARAAIALNGREFRGRMLVIHDYRARQNAPGGYSGTPLDRRAH